MTDRRGGGVDALALYSEGMVVAASYRAADNVLHLPPRLQPGFVHRPRVDAVLERCVRAHRVTVVSAPSGFGKTSAVRAWAASRPGRVAWLTLGTFDDEPAGLAAGIVRTLQSLVRAGIESPGILAIDRDAQDVRGVLDRLVEAVDELEEPVCLVIDDAHRAGNSLTSGLLGALIDAGPENLRLVIVGAGALDTALARRLLSFADAVVRSEVLALTLDEVAALTDVGGRDASAAAIRDVTSGWPIAVRFIQMTGIDPEDLSGEDLMRDYVRDHIIRQLPLPLRQFVLDSAVCDHLSVELAVAVTGRADASDLLRQCVRIGLFIDRFETRAGVAYRWHGLFARMCREILDETAPGRRERVQRAAAAHLEATDPMGAIGYWLEAADPGAAVRVIMNRWVEIIVNAEAAVLDRVCAALPAPYDDHPGVLLVRASAHDALGAREVGQTLLARARSRAAAGPSDPVFETNLARAHLFLLDDRVAVANAADEVHAQLVTEQALDPHVRTALLYLLGWTGMRHRHDPQRTVELLTTAAREASALGDDGLRRRALRTLSFVLAWAGELRRARSVLVELRELPDDDAPWVTYASGSTAAAAGVIAYWGDDLAAAAREFDHVTGGTGGARSFDGVARMMLAFTAAASGDARLCRRAEIELDGLPRRELQGVSWPAFRDAAHAALAEATGRVERALQIAARYAEATDLPMISVVLAGIVRRQGDPDRALQMLRRLRRYEQVSYVRVAALVTAAIVHRRRGRDDLAHELTEQALGLAEAQGLRRLLSDGDPQLRSLLSAHLNRGSDHALFIAGCLTSPAAMGPLTLLSPRERAVLEYLGTPMTIAEIADALHVSVNTVKTHSRSIYRKLGVNSRRDAVRLLR